MQITNDQPQPPPLVILGFDSGDSRLLRRWAAEGYLPTVASIMKRGCWAEIIGPELMLEHGAWVSIFSGISRDKHGFYSFRQLEPGSYNLSLVYGAQLKAPPFWSSGLSRYKRALIMDVPEVALIPGLRGSQVANWAIHRGYVSRAPVHQPQTEPAGLLSELNQKFGPPIQILENPDANTKLNQRLYTELLARIERKGRLCRHLLHEKPDLAIICFGESHTAGHQYWKHCQEVAAEPLSESEFTHAVRDVYQAIDRQMGLLLAEMPPSSNVVILASLGLTDHYPTGQLMESFCRQLGYQATPRTQPNRFRPMTLARQVLPESWRIAWSRRLSRETRERLFAQRFQNSIDWQKTTAFAIPSIYTGFIRVNLRGREPKGIVDPGTQYQAVLRKIENDLWQLIDPRTGECAIERVDRTAEIYRSDYPSILPDLVIHWKSCPYFLDRVVHPQTELVQKRPEFFRDSEHTNHGFVAAAGPHIRADGRVADIDVLDLAPTLLALLGESKSPQMTGNVVRTLVQNQPTSVS